MGRSLLVTQIDYPTHLETEIGVDIKNTEIVIATTHFESQFNRNIENTTKLEQYKESERILEKLYNVYKNVILCADLNILPHEETKFIDTDKGLWKDSWKENGNKNNKFTFDGNTNIYLQMKNCRYRSRLDRILYKTNICTLNNFERIESKEGYTEPSDHYGVLSKFSINT
jgi:exonuclease III